MCDGLEEGSERYLEGYCPALRCRKAVSACERFWKVVPAALERWYWARLTPEVLDREDTPRVPDRLLRLVIFRLEPNADRLERAENEREDPKLENDLPAENPPIRRASASSATSSNTPTIVIASAILLAAGRRGRPITGIPSH